MRNILLLPVIAVFCLFGQTAGAQDQQEQLNLPGDNLNLYAVMKLFQESPTLEEFEKKLNDQSLKVNNLDLDGNNQIDYIKVIDNVEGSVHNIALKVDVNKSEDQDVAVFVVKKEDNGQVDIQLIGDEALYGKDYIIEPNTGSSTPTPNPGYTGTTAPGYGETADVAGPDVQVSAWPLVTYIYVPTYTVWRSPWRWGYYPTYWRPWTPFYWHEYYGYQYHWDYYYRAHYRYTPVYRFPTWREHYYGGGFRSRSTFVEVRYNRGDYRQTYTRPDLANRGADLFRRDHPSAPHVNRPLPRFDNNNNNRPIVNRPNRDATQPGNGRDRRPGNNNGTNPSERPATRPTDVTNNAGRPVNPVNPGAGNGNNNHNRPGGTRPSEGTNTHVRPINRPATPKPVDATNNTTPNRPVTRPNDANNTSRPARPVNTNAPVTRPANNNFPNRPVTRPAPVPRQQEMKQPQPASRPANERAPRERRGNN